MERKTQIFNMIEPSENLKVSIINMIKKEESKRNIYKIVFGSVLSMSSILIMVISIISIVNDAYQSGLSSYLSLIFSDGASIATYWQSYIMSVVESLPIIPITIVVASVGIFIWSINSALENLKGRKSIFVKFS